MSDVRSTLVASCLVVLLLLASPTAVQVVGQSPTAAPGDAGAGSMTSLQRIRRALAVTPPGGLLNLHEYVHVFAEAPEMFADFESLFGDFDLMSGPTPFGAPTHCQMHGLAPPMGALYSRAVSKDILRFPA